MKQQQRTSKTQRMILKSAQNLFDNAGYDNITVDQIATKSGVAKGTVFVHFPDKASLLTAVRIRGLEQLVEEMESQTEREASSSPVQTFLDLLNPWLALFAKDPDFTQVFLNQADLRGGPWAMRLYEVCCALDAALEHTVTDLIKSEQLSSSSSVTLYAQGIQAFFYHVLIGLHSGATANAKDQESLLRSLLTRWLI